MLNVYSGVICWIAGDDNIAAAEQPVELRWLIKTSLMNGLRK
jgi:hypothetical protein